MRRSFFSLCLLLGLFSLVGFGCKKRGTASLSSQITNPITPIAAIQPTLKSGGVEEGVDPRLVKIQRSMDALAKTDSYQLDLRLPDGKSNGRLFYAKHGGIYATLVTEGVITQLYTDQNTLWVKYATTSWDVVPPGEETSAIRTMIRQAFFSSELGANTLVLTGNARVIKEEQDPSGCTLYSLEQTFFVPSTYTERFSVCLAGGYPTSIRYIRPEGTSILTYSRLNDPTILSTSPIK